MYIEGRCLNCTFTLQTKSSKDAMSNSLRIFLDKYPSTAREQKAARVCQVHVVLAATIFGRTIYQIKFSTSVAFLSYRVGDIGFSSIKLEKGPSLHY